MFPLTKSNKVAPDLDSVAIMKACRVCLAMRVKMHHMLEHKLNVMYERVIGVEVNTEDNLPQMLCWECVARLSSANHFKEKALRTQQILLNKVSGKIITIKDIESIDRVKNQLESSLKFFKVNDCNLHIIKETNDIDDECNSRYIDEAVKDFETNTEGQINVKIEVTNSDDECSMIGEPCPMIGENSAVSDDLNKQVDLFLSKKDSVKDAIKIKSEEIYATDDVDERADNCENVEITVKVEHTSRQEDSTTEMSQVESHILGDPTPVLNQGSNKLPHYQGGVNFEGLNLSNYNTQHSSNQVTDHALATHCNERAQDPINVDMEKQNNTNSDDECPMIGEPCPLIGETDTAVSDALNKQVDLFLSKEDSVRDAIKIKSEEIYVTEDVNRDERSDNCENMDTSHEELEITVKVEHTSTQEDSTTELSQVESHILGDPTPVLNQKSNELPYYQKGVNFQGLNLGNYNTQHSSDQVTDHALATHCNERAQDPINVDMETQNNTNSDDECAMIGEPCPMIGENTAVSDALNKQVDLFLSKEDSVRDAIKIKSEEIYVTEDVNKDERSDNCENMDTSHEELEITVKVEHTSTQEDSTTETSQVESHILGDPTPVLNQGSNKSPHYQKGVNFEGLSLSNYNAQHSSDQVTDHALATHCNERAQDPINVDMEKQNNTGNTNAPIHIHPTIDHLKIINPSNTSKAINKKTGKEKKTRAKRKDPRFQNLFICDICDNQYQKRNILIRHIREHSILKSYSCTYCSFKTVRKDRLTLHTNSKHTKSVSFNCNYCKYVTYRKDCLAEHINATHTRSVSYDCPHCSFKTYKERNLKAHINTRHIRKNTFNCSFCSFTSHLKSILDCHVNAKHTKDISFSCSYCSFKTCTKNYLNRHINIKHTQEVSYDCDMCKYKTFNERNLKKHITSKHTRSVSYNCSYCRFNTYVKGSLTRHVNTKHSSQKSPNTQN